jgi:hypothetical protein
MWLANANKFPFEKLKPGRFSAYYSKGKLPMVFRSMQGEKELRSTPGLFEDTLRSATKKGFKNPSFLTPQIKLVTKEDLAAIVSDQLRYIDTPEKRRELEAIPKMKEVLRQRLEELLAMADWAEQTYKIKINVDSGILEWIGKAK